MGRKGIKILIISFLALLLSSCKNNPIGIQTEEIQATDYLSFNNLDESRKLQEMLEEHAGATIVFPENSKLKISQTINVPEGTTLKGGTTLSSAGAITMLQLESKVVVEGLNFQGKGQFDYDEIAIDLAGQPNDYIQKTNIKNCTFMDIGGMCINGKRVKDMIVQNCTMVNSGYAGVHIFSGEHVDVLGCVIDGIITNPSNNLGYGVAFSNNITEAIDENPPSVNCRVINCIVKNSPWEGLDTHGGKNIQFLNNQLENCNRGIAVVSVGQNSPIPDYPEAGAENCVVLGNIIIGNGQAQGISVAGVGASEVPRAFTRDITIRNNTLINCGAADQNREAAIRVRDTERITITGNQLLDSRTHGINLHTNVKHFIIDHNVIKNPNSSTIAAVSGIILSDSTGFPYHSVGTISMNQFIKSDAELNEYVGSRAIFVNGEEHDVTVGENESTFDSYVIKK